MIVDIGRSYMTKSGRDVRLLCTDRDDHVYPVVGLIDNKWCMVWTLGGTAQKRSDAKDDLVEVSPEPTHCNWQQQDEDESDYWQSDCGMHFCFPDSGPIDNNMRYCCRCGKPLSETALIWDDESGGFVPGETRYPDYAAD